MSDAQCRRGGITACSCTKWADRLFGSPCRSGRGKYPGSQSPRETPCTWDGQKLEVTQHSSVGRGKGRGECGECTCLTCTKTAPLQGHMQRGNSASGRVPASPGAVQGKGVTAQQPSRHHLPHPHLLHPPPCGWRSTKCSGLLPPQNSLQQLHVWEAGRSCKSGVHFNASSLVDTSAHRCKGLADTSAHHCKGLLVDTHYSK